MTVIVLIQHFCEKKKNTYLLQYFKLNLQAISYFYINSDIDDEWTTFL